MSLIPLIISAIWISISSSLQTLLIADNTMSKMVEFSSRKPYCTVHNDRGIIQRILFNFDEVKVRRMTNESVVKLERVCRSNQVRSPNQGGFIYPGTKWCGPGNIASNYDELGVHSAEDNCCREHDGCPNALSKGQCRQGVCNNSPYTRSHCDCDADLRRCLQNVNTETANAIGAIFFNVVKVICFKERKPCPQNDSCTIEFQRSEMYKPAIVTNGSSRSFVHNLFSKLFRKLCFWKNKFTNYV